MFQILHFADLHLDASFASCGLPSAVGNWRRTDLRGTLGRILSLARERRVDVVTIAGDLYEQSYVLPDTASFLVQQFARLAPTRVLIAPGERDPHTNDSLYALTRWPENVSVYSRAQLAAVTVASGIHLWGAACPASHGGEWLGRSRVDRGGVNLLLLHADDAQHPLPGRETPFSVDQDSIRAAGFDLALLGHQHNGRVWPTDAPLCVYPGSPEPLAASEANDAHSVVLLRIEDGVCAPELMPISLWRHISTEVSLTGCASTDEAARRVAEALRVDPDGDNERTVCDVSLTGVPPADFDVEELAERVDMRSHLRFTARLSPASNLKRLAQERTVRGLVVRRFQARLDAADSDDERRLALSALNCVLQALAGQEVVFNEVE